jgi:hypothetical protein
VLRVFDPEVCVRPHDIAKSRQDIQEHRDRISFGIGVNRKGQNPGEPVECILMQGWPRVCHRVGRVIAVLGGCVWLAHNTQDPIRQRHHPSPPINVAIQA